MSAGSVLVIDDSATILKVVQLVLTKAGYDVRTASDGESGIAQARERRPDVVLLDFVMPEMNGYQVCRALADAPALADVPIVLMSAKGEQVGERFVRVMGIVDYITKPFSPDAISAVVAHTIAKYRGRALPATGANAETVSEELTGPHPLPPPPRPTSPQERRRLMLAELRLGIAEAVAGGDPADEELVDHIQERLTDPVLMRVLSRVIPTDEDDGAVLRGDLSAVPLAEVLTLLADQGQTGVLSVRRDALQALVAFRAGRIDFAGAEGLGDEFLLGRYLLDLNAIAPEELDRFLEARPSAAAVPGGRDEGPLGRYLGQQLLKQRRVAPADLVEALRRQTAERVYEALRWRAGRFSFSATPTLGPLADGAALQLSVDGLLMEGLRRIDEWHLIERVVDDFEAVFLRNEAAVTEVPRGQLTREELAVLELVDGKHSVREIQRQSRLSSFEVSKMLFRLLSIKLIRRRVAPVAV